MLLPSFSTLRFHAKSWWLRRRFTPYVIHRRVDRFEFDFYVGDSESQIWNDLESPDKDWEELRFVLNELIVPGDLVFDCGAHHGTTAVLFALAAGPRGRVVAFEPVARNAEIIRRNAALNRLSTIELEEKAIGADARTIKLRDRSNAAVAFAPWQRGFGVEMVTLDAYASARGLRPTMIKIDVEGYEVDVLEGASAILASAPKIAIELHPHAMARYGGSVERLLALLPVDRYDLWLLENDRGPARRFSSSERIDSGRAHLFARPKPSPG